MNIMVTLNKLKRRNNIISAEYYPEDDKQDCGKLVYDTDKCEVVSYEYCERDNTSFLKTYLKKAVKAIEKCIEKDDYPETVVYMWY